MVRSRRVALPFLLSLSLVLAATGCFEDDPVKVKEKDPIDWPDLTDRDDVAKTIVLCYENYADDEALEHFEDLLHSQYFFALDDRDVNPGDPPILSRAVDVLATQGIFANAILLELSLDPEEGGSWDELPELDGLPCRGCWMGRREYHIRAQFESEGTIYQSTPGSAAVTIIVAPDESDSNKWVLRALFDEYNN
jgi:hypothetical protein